MFAWGISNASLERPTVSDTRRSPTPSASDCSERFALVSLAIELGDILAEGIVGGGFAELDGVTGVALAIGDFGGVSGGGGGFDKVLGFGLGAGEDGEDFEILSIGKFGCFVGQFDTKVNVSETLLVGADKRKSIVAECCRQFGFDFKGLFEQFHGFAMVAEPVEGVTDRSVNGAAIGVEG